MKTAVNKIKRGEVNIYGLGVITSYQNVDRIGILCIKGEFLGHILFFKDGSEMFLSREMQFNAFCPTDVISEPNLIKSPKKKNKN